MPLIDRNGAADDAFTRVSGPEAVSTAQPLVPFAELDGALAAGGNGPLGIEVPNTIAVAELLPVLDRVSLIAIAFPSFSDGRGFSIARQLRERGFNGRLRAVGPLIADQFAYALACGIDEIELPEASAARQPPAQWLEALTVISNTYQRGYEAGGNILDQRRAKRAAGTRGTHV